jgi:3-deoxy-D-manno-octulosonate 8-phosphate phosphatase (KDO 8-P phosphatase)
MQAWLMRNPKSDRLERLRVIFFDVDGVFTDGKTWQDQSGQWRRSFSVRDTMGLRALGKAGIRVVILTPVVSPEIRTHFELIGVDMIKDHCLEPLAAVEKILNSYGYSVDEAAFVSEASDRSGVVELCLHETPVYTTARLGGDGAVFEICNLILQYSGRRARSQVASIPPSSQQTPQQTFQQTTSIRTKVGEL